MNNEIILYVRNRKRQPVGVVVARKNESGRVMFGWSRCNRKDRFDKYLGLELARGRTLGWLSSVEVPRDVNKCLHSISQRAEKYFKVKL